MICTDKSGTLTAGELTVKELYMAGETIQVGTVAAEIRTWRNANGFSFQKKVG